MNDGNAKQQIVDKIKSNSNILVTVSTNPSVDELSAALGLTLLLNKMNKHATAVFSGAIPPAITFLDPQKTFENTVDSLRDFIIALDKEKADHLRYKVDGDVVKIFITPYRTTISGDDLEFSQGDYNVELVLALGVKNPDHLDGALAAHGRILHDAVVATISVGQDKSELGSVDWREENASSLSEMLVSLCDALKSDKALLDEQTATAFLTGIVAATDRFSNERTSSRVMTMAAQLMSAGANQQLIASKLEEAHEIGPNAPTASSSNSSSKSENSDGTVDLSEGESTKLDKKESQSKTEENSTEEPEAPKDDGSLAISHEKQGSIDEVAEATEREQLEEAAKRAEEELSRQTAEAAPQMQDDAALVAEQNLANQLAAAPAAGTTPSVADLQKDLAAANAEADQAAEQAASASLVGEANGNEWQTGEPPSMGGTLNATAEQAAEDKRRSEEADRNHTILNHNSNNNYVGDSTPTFQSPLNAASQPQEDQPMVDPFKEAGVPSVASYDSTPPPSTYIEPPTPATTLADIDKQNRAPHEDARAAVDAAFGAVPFTPAANPAELVEAQPVVSDNPILPPVASLPPLPPLPDFSTLPPLPPAPGANPVQPMGAVPPEKLGDIFTPTPTSSAPAPQSNDPAQFKIPGQG
jgi:hypothetical protein